MTEHQLGQMKNSYSFDIHASFRVCTTLYYCRKTLITRHYQTLSSFCNIAVSNNLRERKKKKIVCTYHIQSSPTWRQL